MPGIVEAKEMMKHAWETRRRFLSASGSEAQEPVFPYPIDVRDFDNGLKLVGVQFDSPGLAAYYSVVRVGSRHEVDEVLSRVDLDGDRAIESLSGGEARRAALSRALLGDPDVLLLDEPTNHLDLPTIQWLEQTLTSCRKTLLMVSHDPRLGDRFDRTLQMSDIVTVERQPA